MPTGSRNPALLTSLVTLLALLLGILAAFLIGKQQGNRGLRSAFEASVKRGQLVSQMQVKLLAAAEAEKSAVMADTDEASVAFADEARQAAAGLETNRRELGHLIESGDQPDESVRFDEFSSCWKRYQEVDREVLDLAVQNTNLKALKLSFTPAEEALERMRAALDTLVDERAPSADAAAIVKEAYRTQLAAVEIHTLEGRHIAEARDEEMDKIEARMKGLDEQVRQGFIRLTAATGESGVAAIDAARAAYADFQKVNAEVISLSRRNSNVRSLAISLGQKRKVTVECQERLSALQDAIRSERFRATR